MKAKKKPIEKLTPADLGIDLTPRIETVKVTEPPTRVGGGKVRSIYLLCLRHNLKTQQVENVDELIARLKAAGITAVKA